MIERRVVLLGLIVCIGLGGAIGAMSVASRLDFVLFDAGLNLLREFKADSTSGEIVIVGIDDQTLSKLQEPTALWHRHIAAFLEATSDSGARAIVLDVVLPERSYQALGSGFDQALIRGILGARRKTVVVAAGTVDAAGAPRTIHMPLRVALGDDGLGYALWPVDGDGVVREMRDYVGEVEAKVHTLHAQLVQRLGGTPRSGMIDYTRGDAFRYAPFAQILEWHAAGDTARLSELMAGKVVLLGSVLPFEDRHVAPVALAAWEPESRRIPGVLILAQSIRTDLAGTTIARAPPWGPMLCGALAGLLWLLGARWETAVAAGAGALLICIGSGLALLAQGVYLPLGGALVVALGAVGTRFGFSAAAGVAERRRMRDAFSKYASEQVLKELLAGGFKAGGEMRFVCALFADIRGYTSRSERTDPARVMATLNRFFEAVIPAIHARDGLVVEFTGDGLYALFGAPKPVPNPCPAAFDAAREFLDRVERLNEELVRDGDEPLKAGLGLHCGDAVVGLVGAVARHRYTATGDAVNVAARLEGLTKELGYPLLVSGAVVERLPAREGLDPLGPCAIKGRAPVDTYGWRPAA